MLIYSTKYHRATYQNYKSTSNQITLAVQYNALMLSWLKIDGNQKTTLAYIIIVT